MTKANSAWLPLLNYSTKHDISLSTLRRRIKAHSIQYKLEGGKYFILDEEPRVETREPSQKNSAEERSAAPKDLGPVPEQVLGSSSFVEASVLSSANRLVEEIKAAYAKILQEKEEQVAQLKDEVVDLRMLCRILEENQNKKPSSQATTKPESSSNDEFYFTDFQNREI